MQDIGLFNSLGLVLGTIQSIKIDPHNQPVAEELAQTATDKDADDNVTVEVHGQQHDDVGSAKGKGVNEGPDQLLQRRSAVRQGLARRNDGPRAACGGEGDAVG
ncbi:hypothetical protein HG530_009006 [Fusarium avenaceum]|nr:hypothetical protein HG530_009006 [Fusarium avenaceum]